MSANFLVPMDPFEMAYRFQAEDRLVGYRSVERDRASEMSLISEALQILPERERDMLELYYFNGKDQVEIGKIFNVTQGDVSYRITRAVQRIRFYVSLPRVCVRRMARDLAQVLPDALHVEIMLGMYMTTSQTAVAEKIGQSQGKVRYRFLNAKAMLKEHENRRPIFKVYSRIFQLISENFNILRSLKSQKRWEDKFK